MNANVTCTAPLAQGGTLLTVTATANGKSVTETIQVKAAADGMTLEMDGEREACTTRQDVSCTYVVRCDKASGQWHFSDLVVWFTQPGSNRPVAPKFKPLFHKPVPEPNVPGLCIGDPTTTDNLTWHFKITLETHAQINEEWLANDGQVYISVTCQEAPAAA
jgi:hypothetical protein